MQRKETKPQLNGVESKNPGLWMTRFPCIGFGREKGWRILWNLLIHSPVHNRKRGQEMPFSC